MHTINHKQLFFSWICSLLGGVALSFGFAAIFLADLLLTERDIIDFWASVLGK